MDTTEQIICEELESNAYEQAKLDIDYERASFELDMMVADL